MANTSKSIDNLVIKITANAGDANTALDSLIRNVTNLGNALNGVDTRTFTDGIKNIGVAVNGVNLGNFQKQMSKLSKSMSDYARNMVKVARNTRTGTSGFRALGRGLTSMQSGLSTINSKINDFASRMKRANKETKNFAQTVGLLYARFFLLIRGAKTLISAVKSSMNYIEVLNYFDASFGQVAERGVSKWSEMGYESAEAYYNSFAERAKKVTSDMSGFFPEADGTLTPTGMASLGMNPQQLMQYQSQFAQMASSMGTTSEQALMLSEVLTKIGADLASVKNMEFEDVWRDMASGLVGMSRTLDKYGANIRNANMEMKLQELGIDATVKSLSQADKALLRTIILLDSSKYAWADLSETLNTPANQFRMLSNNVKLLGQMIGNILLPVVAKILPYLNAFVIVLQRLFSWLAKILGIDLSGLMGKNQGFDNSNISDVLDDAEDLGGALDDDTDSAKKLKKQLQGFDALNNLTTNDKDKDKDIGGLASGLLNDAFLDAVDEYLKAWEDAFKQLENKAQALADKIQKFFLRLAKPIIEAWKRVGDKVVQQWKNAGYNLKLLFKQIGKDFWRVWEEEATTKFFEEIFTIWGNIGEIVQHLANRFREAWVANDNGYRILAGIRDILLIIATKFREMTELGIEWAKHLNLRPLLGQLASYIESLKPVVEAVMGVIKDFLDKVLLPLSKWTLEEGLPRLIQVFIDFNNNVEWDLLRERLRTLMEHLEPFAKTIGEGLIVFVKDIADAIKNFVNSEKFEAFLKKLEDWMDSVTARDVANVLEGLAKAIIAVKLAVKGFALLSGAVTVFKTLIDVCSGVKAVYGLTLGKVATGLKKLYTATAYGVGASAMMKAPISMLGTMFTDIASEAGMKVAIQTAGLTIGTTLVAGITSAIAGFNIGKLIGEHFINGGADAKYYQDFTWFGESGFFKALGDEIVIEFDNMKANVSAGFEAVSNAYIEGKGKINLALSGWVLEIGVVFYDIQNKFNEFKNNVTTVFAEAGINLAIKLTEIKGKFDEFKANVVNSLTETLLNIAMKLTEMHEKFNAWKENLKNNIFNPESWRAVFENIRIGASNAFTNFTNWWNNTVVKKINEMIQKIKKAVSEIKQYFADLRREMSQDWSFNYHAPSRRSGGNIRTSYAPFSGMYANGGFPEDGIFFANSGELVGKFANGQTAVANNEQIISGIQNGVYGAMSESNVLLMEQNSLLQAILEKETGISAGDIFNSVKSSADAYYRMNGKYAFT